MGNSKLLLVALLILIVLATAQYTISVEEETKQWETPAEFMPIH